MTMDDKQNVDAVVLSNAKNIANLGHVQKKRKAFLLLKINARFGNPTADTRKNDDKPVSRS